VDAALIILVEQDSFRALGFFIKGTHLFRSINVNAAFLDDATDRSCDVRVPAIVGDSVLITGGGVSGSIFFHSFKKEKVRQAYRKLKALGYRVVDIYLTDDGSFHVLHAERVATHTPPSLFERNGELNSLAATCGAIYD